MERRLFLQSAVGSFILAAGGAFASSASSASQAPQLPAKTDRRVRFGLATDIHYAEPPYRKLHARSTSCFPDSLEKFRRAVAHFSREDLDFVAELGDLKDTSLGGTRESTLSTLRTIEAEYARYSGERHYVAGNHDFDRISLSDFMTHTAARSASEDGIYRAFTAGGIRFIILDGCFKSPKGGHYSLGNYSWKKAFVPEREMGWLARELKSGDSPVIVFIHQPLNYWDAPKIPAAYMLGNAREVVSLLEKSARVLAVFSGHYHKGGRSFRNGIHYIVHRGMFRKPLPTNAYSIVTVDRNLNIFVEGFADQPSLECPKEPHLL